MTNPVVTVIVVEALVARVFVTGEVAKSGPVAIQRPAEHHPGPRDRRRVQ